MYRVIWLVAGVSQGTKNATQQGRVHRPVNRKPQDAIVDSVPTCMYRVNANRCTIWLLIRTIRSLCYLVVVDERLED